VTKNRSNHTSISMRDQLVAEGAASLHFYTKNRSHTTGHICQQLGLTGAVATRHSLSTRVASDDGHEKLMSVDIRTVRYAGQRGVGVADILATGLPEHVVIDDAVSVARRGLAELAAVVDAEPDLRVVR
jgi:hypothetical protein